MVEGSTQQWFLEVEGRKTGPFATDEILGLFADHEIPGTARILSSAPDSQWITVAALVAEEQPPAASQPARLFVPPPRPAELKPGPTSPDRTEMLASSQSKPELSLMDALRVNKERRTHPHAHALEPVTRESRLPQISRNVWLIGATAVALCAATWGMTYFIKQKAPTIAAQPAPNPPLGNSVVHEVATQPATLTTSAPTAQVVANPTVTTAAPHSNADADRLREQRDREERERDDRDLASSNDAPSQHVAPMEAEPPTFNAIPPAPPPLPDQGLETHAPAGMMLEEPPPPPPPPLE